MMGLGFSIYAVSPALLLTPLPHRPTYQWFWDGTPLSDSQGNHTVSSRERNLSLQPAAPEHSGVYSCCAHNAFGQACSSQNFTLSIAGEPSLGMQEAMWDGRWPATLPTAHLMLSHPR